MMRSMPVSRTKEFLADHPFVLLIKDKATDMILFMGRFIGKQ